MKNRTVIGILVSLILVALIFSMKPFSGVSTDGTMSLKNGMGKDVSVEYKMADSAIHVVDTKKELLKLAEETSLKAKWACNFPATYNPTMVVIISSRDTVTVAINFTATNGFGVPGNKVIFAKFKNNNLLDYMVGDDLSYM